VATEAVPPKTEVPATAIVMPASASSRMFSRPIKDGFELALQQVFSKAIGADSYVRDVRVSFCNRDDKEICVVSVDRSQKPIIIEESTPQPTLYVRVGNATKPLNLSSTRRPQGKGFLLPAGTLRVGRAPLCASPSAEPWAAPLRVGPAFPCQLRFLSLNPSRSRRRRTSASSSSISARRRYDASVKCRASEVRSSSRSSSAAARVASDTSENVLDWRSRPGYGK